MKTKKIIIAVLLVGTLSASPAMAMSSKMKPPVADSYISWTQSFVNFFSF